MSAHHDKFRHSLCHNWQLAYQCGWLCYQFNISRKPWQRPAEEGWHQQAPILHVWMSAWCALVYSSFKTQGTDDKLYCNWFCWPCRVTEVPVCLVGNKQDLCHARQVYEEEGRSVALDNKCHFQEVSASDGYQEIANLFTWLIRQVMEHLKYRSDHRRYSGSKSMSKLINNVFGKRRKSV